MPFVKGQTGWNKGLTKETDKRLDYARPTCFKKGQPSWNKGTKGIMKPTSGSFKKGQFGEKAGHWKGGKYKDTKGYIYIHSPQHPFCNSAGYVLEHRLVMEKYLGRYVIPKEVVHHKGINYPLGSVENKQDNRIENLMLFATSSKHMKFHNLNH